MAGRLTGLARLAGIITDLSLFTPVNLEEEKRKVLSDSSYTPQFRYKKRDFSIDDSRRALERYHQEPQDADERVSNLVHERVRELTAWLDLHAAKDNESFTRASTTLYGTPSPRVIAQAKEDLERLEAEEQAERALSAEDVKPRFEQALAGLGLDWPVVITDNLFTRMHLVKGQELRIKAGERFNERDVEKLIVHEVDTHARRYANGLAQDNGIFAIGTAHFLETEEGLATYNEEAAGVLPDRVKRNLAARVVAADMALRKPFTDVYRYLALHLPVKKAFDITLSVKRGLKDQSKPGAFTKPAVYYSGYQKVKVLEEEDRRLLYVGKVSINHIPLIRELVEEGKVKQP